MLIILNKIETDSLKTSHHLKILATCEAKTDHFIYYRNNMLTFFRMGEITKPHMRMRY